jgi:hypothetical protein
MSLLGGYTAQGIGDRIMDTVSATKRTGSPVQDDLSFAYDAFAVIAPLHAVLGLAVQTGGEEPGHGIGANGALVVKAEC